MNDSEWQQEFDAMPITGNCDSGCGKPATTWFGNTNCATCGDKNCIDEQQRQYNEFKPHNDFDDE